jgi:hypothetical protein
MNRLEQTLQAWLTERATQHRLLVRRGPERSIPIPSDDPAAIVSRIPDLHLDCGDGAFSGRRRSLRFQRGRSSATLLARVRPPSDDESALHLEHARDRAGRDVPVSVFDKKTRTLRLLLDLAGSTLTDSTSETDGADLIFDALMDRPMRLLLADDGPPWVGAEVPDRVRAFLRAAPARGQPALARDMSLLQRLADANKLPALLVKRLHHLQQLAARPWWPDAAAVQDEVDRLQRLVLSRACAAIRVGDEEISGVMNPRRACNWRIEGLSFRLQLGSHQTALRVRSAVRPGPLDSDRQCLGQGITVFRGFERTGDLYGTVDTVLNFMETNNVGAMPEGSLRRLSIRDLVNSYL